MLSVSVEKTLGALSLDIAFETKAVGVTALFGPSGSGKTSVVNMVAGLLRPDFGRIAVNGRALFDSASNLDLAPERRRSGYVFQDGRLFPHLNVRENLVYGMGRVSRGERLATLSQVVELLGIGGLLSRRPATLSGGEKQRVAIGRALLSNPSFLLMDEPLASLDDSRKAEVLRFIARIPGRFSIPILYVTHSVAEIRGLADTMIVLREGRVTATGAPEAVAEGVAGAL